MKLTTQQIATIEEILISKGIKYDDVKIEVLDHIASEIENEIEATHKDFQEVYKQAFERWKAEFNPTRAFFSLTNYYPKLVKSKFGNQFKKELVTALVSSLLLFTSFQFIENTQGKLQFLHVVKEVLFYTYFTTATAALLIKYFISKSKVTSTYKHLFDSRFAIMIVFLSVIFNSNIPQDSTNQNLFVGTISCLFVFLASIIFVGVKHFQFQRKFSIQ
jgi:hypothetical protein